MKPYIKLYCDTFGISFGEFIGCELCGKGVTELHHIHRRGAGGKNKDSDVVENIMPLCREHHIEYGDKKQYKPWLYYRHLLFLKYKFGYDIKEEYLHYLSPPERELELFDSYELELKNLQS